MRNGASRFFRANGVEAASAIAAREKNLDCIISDFNMTPVNGLQFLSAVRTGSLASIPRDQQFILLTGHGEIEVVRAARTLDVSGYVVKPVALKTLAQALQRAFSRPVPLKTANEYEAIKLISAPA